MLHKECVIGACGFGSLRGSTRVYRVAEGLRSGAMASTQELLQLGCTLAIGLIMNRRGNPLNKPTEANSRVNQCSKLTGCWC